MAISGSKLIGRKAWQTRDEDGHSSRRCLRCASITGSPPDQTQASAAPFATVAKRTGFDAARLALFLLDPHPGCRTCRSPATRRAIRRRILRA